MNSVCFPGFPSCSVSLLCEQPPLRGSAAWGTAVLPGELQTRRVPSSLPLSLAPSPIPCRHSLLHPAWILCLGTCCPLCAAPGSEYCSSCWKELSLHWAVRDLWSWGHPPPCAGCLYISKEGSLTQMDCLGLDYSLFIPA